MRTRWVVLPWLVLVLAVVLAVAVACALGAPPATQTLAPTAAASAPTAAIDRLADAALTRADAAPGDVVANVLAAQRLFQAAELRLQLATVVWLDDHPQAKLAAVLAADDQLDDGVRRDIVSLCTRGLEVADRAATAAPDDVAARLQQALHLSLLAWANGAARSLFAGYGPRLVKAIDAAVRLAPEFDGGAPLRLQGRFRARAPWPYGDLAMAKQALQRAVDCAPLPVNCMFFGDLLAASGDVAAAIAQWQRVLEAKADEPTQWSAPQLRIEARRRLDAPR